MTHPRLPVVGPVGERGPVSMTTSRASAACADPFPAGCIEKSAVGRMYENK